MYAVLTHCHRHSRVLDQLGQKSETSHVKESILKADKAKPLTNTPVHRRALSLRCFD